MKNIKADEYYSNDLFEVARFGDTVITHNKMTEEQHQKWIFEKAGHYEEEKEKIDNLIEEIKEKITFVDPLMLFNFLTSMNLMTLMNLGAISEIELPSEANFQLRNVEYIQSLLVSMGHDPSKEIRKEDQEAVYHEILYLCTKLYSKIPFFYSFWSAKQQVSGNLSSELPVYYKQ